MPIIKIFSQAPNEAREVKGLITEVQRKAAEALGDPIENVWVVFCPLQNDLFVGAPIEGSLLETPQFVPFVEIRAKQGRSSVDRQKLTSSIAQVISNYLAISAERIWIHYQEMNPQDIVYT